MCRLFISLSLNSLFIKKPLLILFLLVFLELQNEKLDLDILREGLSGITDVSGAFFAD